MTRPAVADWLPPALREAPAPDEPRAARRPARRGRAATPAARAGHRRGLGRLLRRELCRLGGALHRLATRPARRRRSPRSRLCRRTAPSQGHSGRARGLRGSSDRLDGARARGLADHGLGTATPAIRRRLALPRSTFATARASASGRRSNAAAAASRRRARGRRALPRRSSGRGRCGRSSRSRPRPLPEASRFALHPLGTEAPLYLKPRPRRLSSDVGAAAGRSRTGDELDAPVRATYRVVEALAGPSQITYGTNWRLDAAHPLAAGLGDERATAARR